MDPIKIGAFLRELRKEKNLTQQEVAEVFMVTNRTISRWETGANMPDISIITEIADFYGVDVRELIEGERMQVESSTEIGSDSSEDTDKTLEKVIEYAGEEKIILSKRVLISSIAGLVGLIIYVLISRYNVLGEGLIVNLLESISLFLVYSSIITSISFTTGRLEKKYENRKKYTLKKIVLVILLISGVVILLGNIAALLMIGSVEY